MFVRFSTRSLASTLLLTVLAPVPCFAQTTPGTADAAADQELNLEEIVVTGTRLQASGFNSPTPVTMVGTDMIEQRAPANIADVVTEVPAFKVSTSDTVRGATGAQPGVQNLLNLRGLAEVRTLTLINGRRTVGTNFQGTFDTNMIPIGLVERVEVVTGGASAAYGSDAVAGVANFILRDKLEGLSGTLQGGITNYGDGAQYTGTFAGGTGFADDRGHVIFGADYSKSELVGSLYERPWGRQEIATISRTPRPAGEPASVVAAGVEPSNAAPGGLIQTALNGQFYAFDASGTPYVFQRGTVYGTSMVGSTANYGYGAGTGNPIRVPTDRVVGMTRTQYDFSDAVSVFGELTYGRSRLLQSTIGDYISGTNNTVLPSIVVQRTNPNVPTSVLPLIPGTTFTMGRINIDFGGNYTAQDNTLKRLVVGVTGKVFNGWDWEAYYQIGRMTQNIYNQGFVYSAFQKAVNGCTDTTTGLDANGRDRIAAYESLSGKTCVPFNPFGIGRNPAAAYNYFLNEQSQQSRLSQDVAAASISGSPFSLWAGEVSFATGLEHRQYKLDVTADPITSFVYADPTRGTANIYSDTNRTAFGGSEHVIEGFIETGVPLLKDKPFAQSLDFNGAIRRTDYELGGKVTTWKLGTTYKPVDELLFRLTRSRDIRAPNLQERFFIGGGLGAANLINTIPNGTVGLGGSVNTRNGGSGATAITQGYGNPDLVPEIANTFTTGVVFQSGGLRTSVDYYRITVGGAITRLATDQTLAQCALGSTVACAGIRFDTSALGIALIRNQSSNVQTLKLSGWDIEAAYRFNQPFGLGGNFEVRALVNHAAQNDVYSPLTATTTDQAGTLATQAKWSGNVTFAYSTDLVSFDLQFRGFNSLRGNSIIYDANGNVTSNTVLGPEDAGYNPANNSSISKNRYPGRVYVNPSVQVRLNGNVTVFANVDNLLNTSPPSLTVSSAYDLIGRRYRAGVRMKL